MRCADLSVMKRVLYWAPVVLGILFMLLLGWYRREQAFQARNDFVTFYAGAKLAGTGSLYSREANVELIKRLVGVDMGLMYIRPPFYAALLKPMSLLPFLWAYAAFSVASLAAYIWFVARFAGECPALPFLAAISIPFLADLSAGQDASFMLVILGSAILLTRKDRDFVAGLVLSLCAFKFHLFLFVPVFLLLKRRWRMVGGGVCGTLALTLIGVMVNGIGSIPKWLEVLRDPWINPDAAGMPNLHGLVTVLNGDVRLEMVFTGAICILFLWMAMRTDQFELLLAASLVCGLLLSFHSTIVDDLLLFPVLILLLKSSEFIPLRALAGLILTPIPYFLVLAGPPYSGIFAVLLLLILVGLAFTAAQRLRSSRDVPVLA